MLVVGFILMSIILSEIANLQEQIVSGIKEVRRSLDETKRSLEETAVTISAINDDILYFRNKAAKADEILYS